jgi:RNA polymerase sigma-70 factor, ECF subfamily
MGPVTRTHHSGFGLARVGRADRFDGLDAQAVLAAAIRREQWAIATLFRAYQPLVLRYLRAQAPGVADDLAGEVWVAVARGLGRFTGDEAGFRGWLFTIARRRLSDHRRNVGRRRTDPVPQERLDAADQTRDGLDPASVVVDRIRAQQAIDVIMADLSADQADAVLLRVVAGLDVAEVARIMGRTPGAVRVLCHRALRRVAPRLAEGVLAE